MIPFHGCQYPGRGGHYESWFLRANHPQEARAFWIRYTLFVPADGKREPLGEIWAIYFDGTRDRVVAVKEEQPYRDCTFERDRMEVGIGASSLESLHARGGARSNGHHIGWQLRYDEGEETLLFLPEKMYKAPFPKAKSVVSRPHVSFRGKLEVDGETIDVDGWHGSENHNWGSQHTNQYAWGQVMGFDDAPEALLECATARVKIGPVPTPWLTIACLRLDGHEYRFNEIPTALKAKGRYKFFEWNFDTRANGARLKARITAPRSAFTGLTYYNPPGGSKTCLNSKIARCEAEITLPDGSKRSLTSESRAAFEILTDRKDHGVPLSV